MRLHDLSPAEGSRKTRKRLGRGESSGLGKTSGKGHKGHNARSGGGVRPGYEGGQMPLHRRLPKRGFTNLFKTAYAVVNVRDLNRFESGAVIDRDALVVSGILKDKTKPVKLLGQGEITIPLNITLPAVSESARKKVEAAGGKVEVA